MNKILLILFLIFNAIISNAQEEFLDIDAKFFEADQKKQIMVFTGDVKMTKNKDILLCQKLVINTVPAKDNPKKQIPKDYVATGKVSFSIQTKDNILKGRGDKVFYYPDDQKYIIVGNGYLEDTKEGKKLTANKIHIDEKTGRTRIDGGKNEPVKFRLKLNESGKKK